MERNDNGKYSCPHNEACECDVPECHKCGWNPEVAARRLEKMKEDMTEKLYKIPFAGYCEVWATSAEKAVEKADNGDMFFASYVFGAPVLLGKEENDELD